jgi:hypothetical protein
MQQGQQLRLPKLQYVSQRHRQLAKRRLAIMERGDSEAGGVGKTHVHDSAVDVAELLEAKEPRTVCGVIEGERLKESQPDNFAMDF